MLMLMLMACGLMPLCVVCVYGAGVHTEAIAASTQLLHLCIQDFLGLPHEQRRALTFKLRAPPAVTLNLYHDLPAALKTQIPPR